jgi:murein DD-endopeptidase MepM/ murein hydrolase activator NlpD
MARMLAGRPANTERLRTAALPHWQAMRGALLALLLIAAGAVLVPASEADSPARARAEASIVTGSLGDFGTLTATGDAERTDDEITVEDSGMVVGAAEAVARASRAGGLGTARAAALARRIDLFDGLVTATLARRTATATAATGVVYAGRIVGLEVEGRQIGDIREPSRYVLSDGGSVVVNKGRSAIRVTLGAPRGELPAGTRVDVAVAQASAADQVVATPTPTPTATATPAKKNANRRKAPKVRERLTGQRYAFPVYGKASVADDFGAARADTGAHQGNDVFAPFGAPVLAVADGVVERVGTLPISGNRLWLRTAAGDAFFYAHLSAFSPDAVNGRKVKAGTVLGFTGNTGDAEPTPPHVHFEIHPGDKDAIDPHAILLAWQENRDVPPGAWLERHGADTAQRPGALVEVRDFIAGE